MIDVIFHGTNLRTLDNIRITEVVKDSTPSRQLSNFKLANADGRVQVSAFYDLKEIVVNGDITASSRELFEQNRASLIQKLVKENGNLDLMIGGELVRYKATVENTVFSESMGGYGAFSIKFSCSDPIGTGLILNTALASTAITTSVSTHTLTSIAGSYNMLPKITVTTTTVSGATNKTITITNPLTERAILVQRDWSNGDVLVIDGYEKTVQVAGSNVEFDGTIPDWPVGANSTVKYEDEFTTRSVNLKIEYFKRYL